MIDVFPILDDPKSLLVFRTDWLMLTQFSDLPAGRGVEAVDELFGRRISSAREAVGNSFSGVLGQQLAVPLWSVDGPQMILVCGLGLSKSFDKTVLYKAVTVATHTAMARNVFRLTIPVAHVQSTGLSFVEVCEVIAQVQDDCLEDFLIDVICTKADSRLLTGSDFNIRSEFAA